MTVQVPPKLELAPHPPFGASTSRGTVGATAGDILRMFVVDLVLKK